MPCKMYMKFLIRPLSLVGKTLAAIYWAVGSGLEGNCAAPAARCANGVVHFALSSAAASVVFTSITAVLAALWLVIESFLLIEILFTRGENKFLSAIFANDSFVLKIQWNTSFSIYLTLTSLYSIRINQNCQTFL